MLFRSDQFQLRIDGYPDFLSEAVRKDREGIMRAGGYKVEEAWERALRSAVAALHLPPPVGLDPTTTETYSDNVGVEDVIMASV